MARDETGGPPLPGRLSLGALGLALVLVVGGAWVTGGFYLLARLGPGSPVALARLDGPHVYAGLVGGAFVVAKVARVGLRRRVAGVPGLLLWQRWVSWSMLGLYAAVFASGIVLLLPVHGDLYENLSEVHLLTSIWAAVLTIWHVWHYRARALPYVSRLGASAVRLRFWIGLGVLVPATLFLLLQPRAASQLPQVLGGSSWSRTGLSGTYLRTITTSADGSTVIAGGDGGVFFSRDGVSWGRLGLPPDAPMGTRPQSTVREVVSLAAGRAGIYAGTTDGLYFAPTLRGPLREIGLSGQAVWTVAIDPADARSLAAATSTGPMLSGDGGATWRGVGTGLANPQLSTALAYYRGGLFVSDLSGVFRLDAGAGAWRRVSGQTQVIWLAPGAGGDELYATSTDLRVEVLAQRRWSALATPPLPRAHQHGGGGAHAEPGSVLAEGSRLYLSGTGDGISASADAGRTWTQLGVGMVEPAPAQLVAARGALWAATGDGVYRYPLTPGTAPSAIWWALVGSAGLGSGLLITVIALPEERRPRYLGRRPLNR